MTRAVIVCSAGGLIGAAGLHVAALFGLVVGDELLLVAMFALVFICFGSAIFRGAMRAMNQKHPPELTPFAAPRWLQWLCIGVFAYAMLSLLPEGKVTHQLGTELTKREATALYGALAGFFAFALLLHVAFSHGSASPAPEK